MKKKQRDDLLLSRLVRDGTPHTGNICRARCCEGVVVRKPTSVRGGRQRYNSDPECIVCDRVYLYAVGTIKVTKHEADARKLKEVRKAS
jgi:hypothetical protein